MKVSNSDPSNLDFLPSLKTGNRLSPFHFCPPDAHQRKLAVVRQKASGPGGPAMDILFGMPAFNKTYDVCDILESIAPNVNDLQLFRDDVGETFMCCKSRGPLFSYFLSFQFCFTSLHMGRCFALPVFTFSPLVAILLPFTGSLFARPGPLGLG